MSVDAPVLVVKRPNASLRFVGMLPNFGSNLKLFTLRTYHRHFGEPHSPSMTHGYRPHHQNTSKDLPPREDRRERAQ